MKKKRSYFELVCGSMYSGKSEELIRRIKRSKIANKKTQLFKPVLDDRYSNTEVVTHAGEALEAEIVKDSHHLLASVNPDTEVVGIDEVQFFDVEIVNAIETLNENGIKVICAGLDMYSSGEPFGPIAMLLVKAKYVDKLHAVCVGCGDDAYISLAIQSNKDSNNQSTVKVGSTGEYIAVCEDCKDKI